MSQIENLTNIPALAGSKLQADKDLVVVSNSENPTKLSFKAALEKVADKLGINSKIDLHSEMVGLQKQALTRSNFSNKELLLYQVKAQQMHMQAEMVSKVGESMLGTMRKLQQGQGG